MTSRCTVCAHPDRADIESALLSGSSHRAVARAAGLSRAAVDRHVSNGHVSELLAKASVAVEQVRAEQVLGEAITLYERASALLTKAEHADDRQTQLGAIREARSLLVVLAQVGATHDKERAMKGDSSERPDLDDAIDRALADRGYRTSAPNSARTDDTASASPQVRALLPPQ